MAGSYRRLYANFEGLKRDKMSVSIVRKFMSLAKFEKLFSNISFIQVELVLDVAGLGVYYKMDICPIDDIIITKQMISRNYQLSIRNENGDLSLSLLKFIDYEKTSKL